MRVAAITDKGLHRKRNEDSFFISEDQSILVVCDGMGGHKGGNVASQLAVQTIQDNLKFSSSDEIIPALRQAVKMANEVIYTRGKADALLTEMGTTVTVAVIDCNHLFVAHVGDSSLFLYRPDGGLKKVTRNHTLSEQMLTDSLAQGENLNIQGYHHILTRAVGVEAEVEVDIFQEELETGDWILLCTDGLTDLISENEILEHLQSTAEPQATARAMLETAIARGGYDNITIVLLSV